MVMNQSSFSPHRGHYKRYIKKSVTRPLEMDGVHSPPESGVVVVMVPLPAQGHLNQMLHFSRLVSAKGIPVHYIGSATHNRQAKHRVHGWDPSTIPNIHFHDFPLPPFLNPTPDPHAVDKFPIHLQPTFDASLHLREPISKLLHNLGSMARRVVVVHDPVMAFAAKEASSVLNCEAYALRCVSAFAILIFIWEVLERPENLSVPDGLPRLSREDTMPESFTEFVKQQAPFQNYTAGYLYNTCRILEDKFVNELGREELGENKRQWVVGPLHPVVIDTAKGSRRCHKCLDWLDEQPSDSVIYISFGTMTSISDEQITELAIGLERSEQRFIWALREADRGDIYAEGQEARKIKVPDGFEERVEGRGIIVRDWAPQLEILAHSSTGGFLSHCGWNSCMESMSMGVPIAAWPMHSDQPSNTILVTEVLKIGVVVREWVNREALVSSVTIESAVRKLMATEEGTDRRKRAKELGIAVRQAASEGGTSAAELDSFINYISR